MSLYRLSLLAVLFGVLTASPLMAQNQLGGHIGFVIPMVTRVAGDTVTVADDFVIGFPMGITVKATDRVAFDLEFVPLVQNDPLDVNLVVHPGVLYSLPNRFTLGVRAAFETDNNAAGFTPLIARSFKMTDRTAFFAEVDFPIRWQTIDGSTEGSFAVAAHFGIGF